MQLWINFRREGMVARDSRLRGNDIIRIKLLLCIVIYTHFFETIWRNTLLIVPLYLGIIAAAVIYAAFAVIISIPAFRMRGVDFAMAH